jgi:phage tail sheath protein FI
MRIANAVIDGIKQVTEPFIGEALDPSRQQAIETAIESILADLKSAGALEAYRFGVYFASSADRIRGILTVEVAIVPAFEVRRIRLKLTLKPTM